MSKNLSSVVDDDVANFIDKEREKRGILKSRAINLLLKEKMMSDPENVINNSDNRVLEKNEIARRNLLTKQGPVDNTNIDIIDENRTIYDIYPELRKENVPGREESERNLRESLKNPIVIAQSNIKATEKVNNPVHQDMKAHKVEPQKTVAPIIETPNVVEIPKVETPKVEIPKVETPTVIENNITKGLESLKELDKLNVISPNKKLKLRLTEMKRMGEDLENINIVRKDTTEEAIKKYLEKQEFDKNIKEMHTKIKDIDDRVCKDGDCTKRELSELRKDVSGLAGFSSTLNKDLSKLSELDNLKTDLQEIKTKLKKNTVICPNCGFTEVPHLASYCPDCGSEFHAWTDDDTGNLISSWKPYKERNKK